jgi:hypothetical protein
MLPKILLIPKKSWKPTEGNRREPKQSGDSRRQTACQRQPEGKQSAAILSPQPPPAHPPTLSNTAPPSNLSPSYNPQICPGVSARCGSSYTSSAAHSPSSR